MSKYILTFIFLGVLSSLFYYPVPMDKIECFLDQQNNNPPSKPSFSIKKEKNIVLELNMKKSKKNISTLCSDIAKNQTQDNILVINH